MKLSPLRQSFSLSQNNPDFTRLSPEIWQKTMGVLQDQCPREDFPTIKAIVEKQLDFEKVFASFEEEPIGAASIGQGMFGTRSFLGSFFYCGGQCRLILLALVHRATLQDGTR